MIFECFSHQILLLSVSVSVDCTNESDISLHIFELFTMAASVSMSDTDIESTESTPTFSQPVISYYILRELASGGCTNAVASFCLNPMDVTKIRMQTEGALNSSAPRIYKVGFM